MVRANETATMAIPPNTFTQGRIVIFPIIQQSQPHRGPTGHARALDQSLHNYLLWEILPDLVARGEFLPSAAAIAEISGFMKKASLAG